MTGPEGDSQAPASRIPYEIVTSALRDRGSQQRGHDWQCPAHDDGHQSLSVSAGNDGVVLLHCHAGCATSDVVTALGLRMNDLFPTNGDPARSTIDAAYDYVDEESTHLYQVVRMYPKDFRQRRPVGSGWKWDMKGVRRMPYRLPQLLEGIAAGRTVFVVEGERDVHAIERAGGVATCNPGGAGKWRDEYSQYFDGAEVVVVADDDEPGRRHAQTVAHSLSPHAASVRIVLPAQGKDARDHLEAGFRLDDLVPFDDGATGVTPPDHDATAQPPSSLAFDQHILDRFAVAVGGVVAGERRLAELTYLVVLSQLLDHPVSLTVKGASSGGKSYTVEQTVRYFPEEAVHQLTGMSERAMAFSAVDFRHRTLLLFEYVAMKTGLKEDQTSYFIRSLLSEGRIRYEVTEKTKNGLVANVRTKEGPTNLIVTTTEISIHPENETRALSVTIDDTPEQTRRVLLHLASEAEGTSPDVREWHALYRWLVTAEHRVTIPYASWLAQNIPPVAVRLRRDFGALLTLIRTHAMLHQANRGRDAAGRIIAGPQDYAVVRRLVQDLISDAIDVAVSAAVRETVATVVSLATPDGVTAKAVGQALGLDKSTALRRLRAASRKGYVRNLEERRGKPGRYEVGEPLPGDVEVLPALPSCFSSAADAEASSGCTVAGVSEGVQDDSTPAPLFEAAQSMLTAAFPGSIDVTDALAMIVDERARGRTDEQVAVLLTTGGLAATRGLQRLDGSRGPNRRGRASTMSEPLIVDATELLDDAIIKFADAVAAGQDALARSFLELVFYLAEHRVEVAT